MFQRQMFERYVKSLYPNAIVVDFFRNGQLMFYKNALAKHCGIISNCYADTDCFFRIYDVDEKNYRNFKNNA